MSTKNDAIIFLIVIITCFSSESKLFAQIPSESSFIKTLKEFPRKEFKKMGFSCCSRFRSGWFFRFIN